MFAFSKSQFAKVLDFKEIDTISLTHYKRISTTFGLMPITCTAMISISFVGKRYCGVNYRWFMLSL